MTDNSRPHWSKVRYVLEISLGRVYMCKYCLIDFFALQVLYTKDHNKWNYDVLVEIIEGPLLNARRLEEAFRVSKFGRRLMTFFQPLYRRFSDIKRTRVSLAQGPSIKLYGANLPRGTRRIANGSSSVTFSSPR